MLSRALLIAINIIPNPNPKPEAVDAPDIDD